MIETILYALGFLACIAMLGIGIGATMVGAVMVAVAGTYDRPFEVSPRLAGLAFALIGLIVFAAAVALILLALA